VRCAINNYPSSFRINPWIADGIPEMGVNYFEGELHNEETACGKAERLSSECIMIPGIGLPMSGSVISTGVHQVI